MNDTSPEMEARYQAMLMALTPGERVAMACRMFSTARALAEAGIQRKFGELPSAKLRRRIFLRSYGGDFSEAGRDRIADAVAAAGDD